MLLEGFIYLYSTMSSTESGRKVTQAVVSTGRAVASTSRVVGGALSQAKGALSVWWSTLTTPSPVGENPPTTDPDFEVLEAVPQENKTIEDAVNNVEVESLSVASNCNKLANEKAETITIHCAADVVESDAEEAIENMQTNLNSNQVDLNRIGNKPISDTVNIAALK